MSFAYGFGLPHWQPLSGGFNPSSLFVGGVQGTWFDPSDPATLFSDTAGTTPSPTPGAGALSVVGKMLDKSGNGNHAISYNTTTARPELSARVNLLTYSEQFDNATWSKIVGIAAFGSGSVVDATAAPDGTTTADLVTTATTSAHYINSKDNISVTLGVTYTYSVYLKKGSGANAPDWVAVFFNSAGFGGTYIAAFNLTTIQVGAVGAGIIGTPTITDVGNGWRRCVIQAVSTATSSASGIGVGFTNNANTASLPSYAALSGENVFIWGADLRPANIGTSVPAYQRIADQYTYDSSGFPRYLVFNGTASGMYTPANLNLSATDKATVFAGVRKISDAAGAILTELSANAGSSNGAFYVSAPDNNLANDYAFSLRASQQTLFRATTFAAPVSNVLSCVYDTAGLTRATEIYPRINGAIPTLTGTGLADSGTGNLGTYALNIGVRSAAATPSSFLNGYIYSLIVVGAASTAAQISSTESWINTKEGGVY